MIKKINTEQIKVGMHIHDLNCGWMGHSFLTNSFAVRDDKTIQKIWDTGVREVYIDTQKGADIQEGQPEADVSIHLNQQMREIAAQDKGDGHHVSLGEEIPRARRIHVEANRIVRGLMEDVRLGKQIELEKVEPMVGNMVDSVFRNPNALLPMALLKNHDTYTFEHSVSVCTLMVAFAREMELSRDVILQIAIGALLHDLGKAKISDEILNKPGKLTDEEFDAMKGHVAHCISLLADMPGITPLELEVAGQHHERFDGSGYPNRMTGEEISLYGQMAAIVDVYDAISSDRVYHKGLPPTVSLKKILEWSDHHFNHALVHRFIRSVGIYPSGTLVRLDSGRLGVVIQQQEKNILEPLVRVFYHSRQNHYIQPEIIDLSKSKDNVASCEDYEKWNIDPQQWLS
ncbi:MAG: HD-GYP domain-containing protein [Syntrophobacterales bacterium]|jgi:HD-GYP domain-containing protein (c-di-GMP phosphodiesterase class II)|nr:HD-GYP domain-containing protein [Syntrophobacterales bacterium]